MGSCETSAVIEANSNNLENLNRRENNNLYLNNEDIEQQKKEFPDMPEWEGERYTGIGIKRMKGYKCDLPIDKLNKKRDEFWDLKNNRENDNFKTWRAINQACVYDELRANMLLEEYELTTASGCINHIIDSKGNHYHIPNYCINDPYFEREYEVKKNIEEKKIKLKLFEPTENINAEKTVMNTMTGKQLKELFISEHKIGDKFCLRLFFGGMEIKDDHYLYQHHLKNGYKIQVMKLPKINDDSANSNKGEKEAKKKTKKKTTKKKTTKKKTNQEEYDSGIE